MSQLTKDKVTKTLVRNVVEKLPAPPSTSSAPIPQFAPSEPSQTEPKFKKVVVASVPSTNSTNLIIENIKNVKSNKKNPSIKSISELDDRKQLAVQEKLTRQMNFPHEHAIYKNLMPIGGKPGTMPSISSRDPLPPKDIEPKLSDFYQRTEMPEFKYILPPQQTNSSGSLIYDGFQLHRLMSNWKQ